MTTNHSCCTPATRSTETAAIARPAIPRPFAPAADMTEGPDAYVLKADIPGARAEDLDILLEKGELTVHARIAPRGAEGRNFVLNEYGVGDFRRSFRIGDGIDQDRIEATVADGVLTLRLPKSDERRPRRVDVKTGH